MARARNIKPSFFTNDLLADIDPLGRLLFIGLWTLADCNGNLEWRPRRIKAQLLAYDNADVNQLVLDLDRSGFVRFYSDGEEIFIHIVNFDRHQNPHKNEREKGVDIPEFSEKLRQLIDLKNITINRDKSRAEPESSESDPADSLLLIPDSLSLDSREEPDHDMTKTDPPQMDQHKREQHHPNTGKEIDHATTGTRGIRQDDAFRAMDDFYRKHASQQNPEPGPSVDREVSPVDTVH